MIIRNLGVRTGRRALAAAAPALRSTSRFISTQPAAAKTQTAVANASTTAKKTNSTPRSTWTKEGATKEEIRQIPKLYETFRSDRRTTINIGSDLDRRYLLDVVIEDDPPEDATLEMLMAAQAHMGHNTALWNPANARYIYGVRDGIHIFSLETTAVHLRRAARVVEEVAYHGGLILFVGTRKGQMPIVVKAAELAGACHLFQKWTPGTITNKDVLLSSGLLEMVDEKDRPVAGFEKHLMDRRPVQPDLVVCFNPLENYTLLYECGLAGIPTVGIVDSDVDPTWVTYQVPANDDSLRSVGLIAGVLGKAGQRGLRRRHAAAEDGVVTWETPLDVQKFIEKEQAEKKRQFESAMEQLKKGGNVEGIESEITENEMLRQMLAAD